MEAYRQKNLNECGVCVLASLVEHFYSRKCKDEIMNEACINQDGLSLFDFEMLAQKYGIFAETYELNWTEFSNLKINNYFVCLINNQNLLHYVIAKKHHRYLQIWDSLNGEYQISYDEFAKSFANVIIMVHKSKCKINIKKINRVDLLKNVDIKYLCLNLFLQMLIIAFSTIGANYLNIIINNAISSNSIKNTLVISVMFIFIYLCNGLSKYILNLYSTMQFKNTFRYLSNEILINLKHKQRSFFNKIDSSYFYLVDTAIYSITNFIVVEISSLCASLIMCATVVIVIICINYWFLFISLISIVINVILGIIQYIFKTNIVKTTIANQNVNNNITRDYIHYLQTQHNAILHSILDNNLKSNYYEFLKIYSSKSKFDSGFEFFQNIMMNVIYVSLILMACYLIINNDNLNIGQLTLLISLSTMLNSSISNICEFVIKRIEYKQMVEIYQNFVSFSNIDQIGDIEIGNVHKVVYKNKKFKLNIKNGSCIRKHKQFILDLLTMNSTLSDTSLFINDIDIKNIQYETLAKKTLIINYDTKISKDWILKHFDQNNKTFINVLKEFKINLTSRVETNIYEQTLINILALMLVKNSVICFNDCLKYIYKKNLKYLIKYIIPYLKTQNFLIIVKA